MRGKPTYIGPFNGGLNTRDSLLDIPPNQAYDCQNVIGMIDGSFRKRDPHINLQNTFAGSGTNDLTSFGFMASTSNFVTTANAKLYSVTKAGLVTDITGATVLTINNPFAYVEAPASGGQGPLYMLQADQLSTPIQWTGSGNAANWTASAGTLTNGDFMVYFKNRIIMGGALVGTNGCGVKACKVGDPRAWDTTLTGSSDAWLTNIDPFDGERIYGFGTVGSYLVVFKKTKCYIVYDLDTGANRPLSTSVGCTARKTIAPTPHGLMFLGNDAHVWVTDGVKVEKLSDVVGIPESTGVPQSSYPYFGSPGLLNDDVSMMLTATGAYANDRYYISVGTNTAFGNGFLTWVYDFPTKSWWPNKTPIANSSEFNQLLADRSKSNEEQLYGIVRHSASSNPQILKLFVPGVVIGSWQDASTNYTAFYQTPALSPNGKSSDPNVRRRYHALRGWAAGQVDVQHVLDDLAAAASSSFTSDLSINTAGNNSVIQQYSVYSLGVGNAVRIKFTATSANPFSVQPFHLYTQQRGD